jgi:hypothetical protein
MNINWAAIQQQVLSAYGIVSDWCFTHQVEADIIVVSAVAGSLGYLWWRKSKMRRRAHRMLWGIRMRRSGDRLAFEKTLIAYGIEDALFEAVYRGDMTQKSADEWRHSFAIRYQMDALIPRKDTKSVKKSIRWRINSGVHRIRAMFPSGSKSVGTASTGKVDISYKPVFEATGLKSSKYASAA